MKAVILAGGLGTRLSEETIVRPKPMVEVGGKPILWHIMKMYSAYGINDFIVCCGYKSYVIKEYFANYFMHVSDVTFHMLENRMQVLERRAEPWTVTLVETGEETMTGGRLKRVRQYLNDDPAFCFTYGDGVSNVDIGKLISYHNAHGRLATVTAVQPRARFGALVMDGERVLRFEEKPASEGGLVSGGFFVLSPKVIDYIADDSTLWEREPLERLAREDQMRAYEHTSFWQAMDTLRDKQYLEELWATGKAPWKMWSENYK
jgi:glucose-1-phosphate cytidylyltransferase